MEGLQELTITNKLSSMDGVSLVVPSSVIICSFSYCRFQSLTFKDNTNFMGQIFEINY